jgi:hypothetical protein
MLKKLAIGVVIFFGAGLCAGDQKSAIPRDPVGEQIKKTRSSRIETSLYNSPNTNGGAARQKLNQEHGRRKKIKVWQKERAIAQDCCAVTGVLLGIAAYTSFMTWMCLPYPAKHQA